MTVLGSAAAVYAGGVRASAVYAGTVKVWPTAPPAGGPDGRASWDVRGDGSVHFSVDHPDATTPGTYLIQVDPAPPGLPHLDWVLGQLGTAGTASTYWGGPLSGAPVKFYPDRRTTTGEAASEWGGRYVLFTINDSRRITDTAAATPAVWVSQFGRLKLTVSGVTPTAGGVALVAVPAAPATVPNPGNVLGTASPPPTGLGTTYWGPTGTLVGFTDPALQHITNAEAVAAWAGNLVVFRFATASDIDTVTVLGPAA